MHPSNPNPSRPSHLRAATPLRLVAAVLLLVAVAAPAGAGPGRGRGGPPLGAMIDFHADELGLDDATRQAIREIVQSSHAREEELRDRIRAERDALHALMEREPVDRDAVMEQVERLSELESEEHKHRIDTMLRIREQLTPEQRAALVQVRERMRQDFMGPIMDACQADREAHCAGQGGPRGIHCLLGHREELSPACGEALATLPPHFGKGACGKGAWKHGPGGPMGPPPEGE